MQCILCSEGSEKTLNVEISEKKESLQKSSLDRRTDKERNWYSMSAFEPHWLNRRNFFVFLGNTVPHI